MAGFDSTPLLEKADKLIASIGETEVGSAPTDLQYITLIQSILRIATVANRNLDPHLSWDDFAYGIEQSLHGYKQAMAEWLSEEDWKRDGMDEVEWPGVETWPEIPAHPLPTHDTSGLGAIATAINALNDSIREAFIDKNNALELMEDAIGHHAHLMADKIDEIKGKI